MIRVRWGGEGNHRLLHLTGHAGAAPKGQDLVCAAVTALVYALAQYLTELEQLDHLEEPAVISLSSGEANLQATAKASHSNQLQGAFNAVIAGLELLEKQYPQNVELRRRG